MYLADEHKIWVCKGEDKICMLPKNWQTVTV